MKFQQFASTYKIDLLILSIILVIAAFSRLYRVSDYLHFLGDEGRDVLVVKRMIVDHKITLLGPITSVGSMYLGPIYYYFMTPFLWAFGMDPVGPAVMIVIFCLFTIAILYAIGKQYFDRPTAILAALLYSLSPLVITQSRFSWNPNAVPLFSIIIIYSLLKMVVDQKIKIWPWLIGLSLGVTLQLHYLSLIFIPIIFLILIMYKKINFSIFSRIIIGTAVTLSPFILFELRHSFPNTQTVLSFATKKGAAATFALTKTHLLAQDITQRAFLRIVNIESLTGSQFLIILVFATCLAIYVKDKTSRRSNALVVLSIWFAVTVLFLSLYKGVVYDYYLVQFFPLPPLLTAITLSYLSRKKGLLLIFAVIITSLIFYFQVKNYPLKKEPNRLLALTKNRTRFILNETNGEKYNFALLTDKNSDHAYIYFLELWGNPPVTIENPTIDPQRNTVTNQLIVLCEVSVEHCNPLGHPLWEIAGFGQAEIASVWDVEGVRIVKLTRFEENDNQDVGDARRPGGGNHL